MGKKAVVYWSLTGNTEQMANAVFEGAKEAGADVELLKFSDTSVDDVLGFDAVALGCPAMGNEVLEEGEASRFSPKWKGKWQARKSRCLARTIGAAANGCANGKSVFPPEARRSFPVKG